MTYHDWIYYGGGQSQGAEPQVSQTYPMTRTSESGRRCVHELEYTQHLARLFNDTIPSMKLTAGLRDFAGKRMALPKGLRHEA